MSKKNIIIFSTALIVVLIDQLTKFLIRQNFELNQSIAVIKNFLHLTYVTNTGSAFGLFKGFNLFFIFFYIVAILIILYLFKDIKENEKSIQAFAGLLLGGTTGNLIDRFFFGAVIDFVDLRIWPVFNLADSAITISVIALIILLWKK